MNSTAIKEINLNLPLSIKGRTASSIPDMKDNLLSIPQLVDNDYTYHLQKQKEIVQCGDTTLICDKDYDSRLWSI